MPRRSLQASIAALLLACGVLLSTAIDHGTAEQQVPPARPAALDPSALFFSSGRSRLLLQGTTVSKSHEAGLLSLAASEFANYETQTDFRPGVILVDNWASTSQRLLYALAATDSAQAVMKAHSIEIRGVTSDAETYAARLESLRDHILADTLLNSDVVVINSKASFEQLCREAFSRLVAGPVSFKQSSAEVRSASFVTLDRVTNFAHDCQHAKIVITGHTDASGDETWNRQLSLARAQAVADHIAESGIDPERLLVRGLGSSEPIADNTTAHGRGLNRRIEFELR